MGVMETASAGVPPAPNEGDPLAQARFGRYRIERLLGEGAMGSVYLAHDPTLDRKVALKLLKSTHSAALRQRFPREARAAARLRHPNVVQVHEAGVEGGVPYLVMDAIEGETLDVYARREGRRAFLAALVQVARGVQHAHAQGICHRDLKPENVLVQADGCPVVTDFGLALFLDQDEGYGQRLTKTGQALGTPLYMAPEQFVGDLHRTGPPADVWALGVMLYEGLTGSPPFEGDSFLELLTAVVGDPLRRPSSVAPGVSRDVDTICERALEKDPRARFPDAGALADELERLLEGEPLSIRPLGAGRRLLRFTSRHRFPLLNGAVLLILTSITGASWLLNGSSLPPANPERPLPSDPLPAEDPERDPGQDPDLDSVQDPGQDPVQDPGQDPAPEEEPQPAEHATRKWATLVEPAHLVVDAPSLSLRDLRRPLSTGHALQVQNPGEPLPRLLKGSEQPSLLFEVELAPGKAATRAEVRLRGADLPFCDSATDPVYYTQFEVFLPEADPFERERTHKGDWSIIWQCSQLGAAPPHYHRIASPPISLQVYLRRLYVRTFHDYARWSTDLDDEEVYGTWRRTRDERGQAPEVGETNRSGQPAAVRRSELFYAGYLVKGAWNKVFMAFRLGQRGSYRVWVNDELGTEYEGPIGYRTADDFQAESPTIDVPGEGIRIRKRASVRFGLYQGYGDPASSGNVATRSRIQVRRLSVGTDEEAVRGP